MNDKTRGAIGFAGLFVVLAAAVWLPSLFIRDAGDPTVSAPPDVPHRTSLAELPRDERIGLFLNYYRGVAGMSTAIPDGYTFAFALERDPAEDEAEEVKAAEDLLSALSTRVVVEPPEPSEMISSGRNVVELDAGEGRVLRLFHIYMEWDGDWRNWCQAYVDLDTGEIYRYYVSSGALKNREDYIDFDAPFNPPEAADYFWSAVGFSEGSRPVVSWDSNAESYANVVYPVDGTERVYSVKCVYYPAMMIDFEFLVKRGESVSNEDVAEKDATIMST